MKFTWLNISPKLNILHALMQPCIIVSTKSNSVNQSCSNPIALPNPAVTYLTTFSQTTKWVFGKLGGDVNNICMLLPTKNERSLHHRSQEKENLVVYDDGLFLKNHALDWTKAYCVCSYWCKDSLLKFSWETSSPFVRYDQFIFCTSSKKMWMNEKWKYHDFGFLFLGILISF